MNGLVALYQVEDSQVSPQFGEVIGVDQGAFWKELPQRRDEVQPEVLGHELRGDVGAAQTSTGRIAASGWAR